MLGVRGAPRFTCRFGEDGEEKARCASKSGERGGNRPRSDRSTLVAVAASDISVRQPSFERSGTSAKRCRGAGGASVGTSLRGTYGITADAGHVVFRWTSLRP